MSARIGIAAAAVVLEFRQDEVSGGATPGQHKPQHSTTRAGKADAQHVKAELTGNTAIWGTQGRSISFKRENMKTAPCRKCVNIPPL